MNLLAKHFLHVKPFKSGTSGVNQPLGAKRASSCDIFLNNPLNAHIRFQNDPFTFPGIFSNTPFHPYQCVDLHDLHQNGWSSPDMFPLEHSLKEIYTTRTRLR